MSEVEELRRYGNAVVQAWERLGRCEDELAPDDDPPACNECRDALGAAIVDLNRILNEHAMMAATPAPQDDGGREEVQGG